MKKGLCIIFLLAAASIASAIDAGARVDSKLVPDASAN